MLSLERAKLLVEGAGAASLAALLADRVGGKGPVAVLLSGGNIDPSLLITVIRHGSTRRALPGRAARISDRPGELVKLLTRVARSASTSCRSSTTARESSSRLRRPRWSSRSRHGTAHALALLDAMQRWGYPVERLR